VFGSFYSATILDFYIGKRFPEAATGSNMFARNVAVATLAAEHL
jgi:hypothetical protein